MAVVEVGGRRVRGRAGERALVELDVAEVREAQRKPAVGAERALEPAAGADARRRAPARAAVGRADHVDRVAGGDDGQLQRLADSARVAVAIRRRGVRRSCAQCPPIRPVAALKRGKPTRGWTLGRQKIRRLKWQGDVLEKVSPSGCLRYLTPTE